MKLRQCTVGLALLVSALACGGDAVFVPNIEQTQFATSLNVDLAQSTKTASGLYYRDLLVGTGALNPADTAKTVSVGYAGFFRNGVQFDAGNLGPFRTGTGAVIAGFDEGLKGMRAGGRRQLILPPSLGYGAQSTNGIPANSILVFVVDLRTVIN
jgi:FKBP-type peptidyl-prolyl cis-trans isomerase